VLRDGLHGGEPRAVELTGKIDLDAGKILGIFRSQVQDQGKL